MPNKVILIATLGSRDLQFAVESDGRFRRMEIVKDNEGDVFRHLLANADRLRYAPLIRITDRHNEKVCFHKGNLCFEHSHDPVGECAIYPGLLTDVILSMREKDLGDPTTIILLNTNRAGFRMAANEVQVALQLKEPFAAGPILARYFAHTMEGLHLISTYGDISDEEVDQSRLPDGVVGYFDFLRHKEMLDAGESEANNRYFRRIDRLFRALSVSSPGIQQKQVILSTVGGIPQINELVRHSALYHFAKDELFVAAKDEFSEVAQIAQPRRITHPVISLNVRRQAEQLLEKGDFSGAAVLIHEVHSENARPAWVRNVESAADFFNGLAVTSNPETPSYLRALVTPPLPAPGYTAFLVESALLQQHIVRAVALTATFVDNALIEIIRSLDCVLNLDFSRKTIWVDQNAVLPKVFFAPDYGGECLGAPYSNVDVRPNGKAYHYEISQPTISNWIFGLKELLPHWANSLDALLEMNEALRHRDRAQDQTLYELRNRYTHFNYCHQSAEREEDIIRQAVHLQLWNQIGSKPGKNFLTAPLPRQVLQGAGTQQYDAVYTNLIRGLITDMRDGDF